MESQTAGTPIDSQTLSRLLKQHGRGLEIYAAQWSLAPDDCVQDAFVKLSTQQPVPEDCVAWLFHVTRNFAISSRRSSNRRTQHESTFASWVNTHTSPATNPVNQLTAADEQQRLVGAIDQLEHSQRELIVMRIWSGLTWSQIAALTKTSKSSAQRNYVATIETIRKLLETPCLTKPT